MSDRQRSGKELIGETVRLLQAELGPSFRIVQRPWLDDDLPLRGSPDLFLDDEETGTTVLVVFRGSPSQDTLDYAVFGEMRRLKVQNRSLNPVVVLVTTTPVPAGLDHVLRDDDVDLVLSDSPAEIVAELCARMAAGAHRA